MNINREGNLQKDSLTRRTPAKETTVTTLTLQHVHPGREVSHLQKQLRSRRQLIKAHHNYLPFHEQLQNASIYCLHSV